jgi:hypothetical protein
MSAPVTERPRTAVRGRADSIPAQRGIIDAADPGAAGTARRTAQQKAYARRDERARRGAGVRPARTAVPAGRPQFVLLIMVLLAVGLVATLWLSTAAAADSYRLQDATAEARVLSEQAERLHREVAVLASAPELARRAGELGMTPVRDPARLVVGPDGRVEVVGEPRAAVPPPPPAPPELPAPPGGEPAPDGADPEGADPEGADPEGAVPEGTDPWANTDGNSTSRLAAEGDGVAGDRAGSDRPATGVDGAPSVSGTQEERSASAEGARGPEAGRGGGGTDAG